MMKDERSKRADIEKYFYKKSEAKARRPGTSQRAIAVSILALISPEAAGLRPIACIAPIPIRPIPSPEPITPRRASHSIG